MPDPRGRGDDVARSAGGTRSDRCPWNRGALGRRSAGARPGPACYGLGGSEPTVTDANLVLGYLSGDAFLGGRRRLNLDLAGEAIRAHVAEPLELDVVAAAAGI